MLRPPFTFVRIDGEVMIQAAPVDKWKRGSGSRANVALCAEQTLEHFVQLLRGVDVLGYLEYGQRIRSAFQRRGRVLLGLSRRLGVLFLAASGSVGQSTKLNVRLPLNPSQW